MFSKPRTLCTDAVLDGLETPPLQCAGPLSAFATWADAAGSGSLIYEGSHDSNNWSELGRVAISSADNYQLVQLNYNVAFVRATATGFTDGTVTITIQESD